MAAARTVVILFRLESEINATTSGGYIKNLNVGASDKYFNKHKWIFIFHSLRYPVRQMCRSKSCVPVLRAGTSYASMSVRDSILSAQRAGVHRTDYVATMSKTIINSRFGRLSYLCRPSVAAENLYVSIWDLHSARPFSPLSNDPALCRSHTGT